MFFIPVFAIYRSDMFGRATAGHYTCRRSERHRSLRPVQTLDSPAMHIAWPCLLFPLFSFPTIKEGNYLSSKKKKRKNAGSSRGGRGVPTNFRLTWLSLEAKRDQTHIRFKPRMLILTITQLTCVLLSPSADLRAELQDGRLRCCKGPFFLVACSVDVGLPSVYL